MARRLKIFGGLIGGIVILGLVLGGLWLWFSRRAIPETRGTVTVNGLSAEVEILRDEFGVAHIYAQNPEDLFFAEGYVHAQERFWQMEFQRRVGAGRLSEIFGEATLVEDRYLRNFGFHELATAAYDLADPVTKRVLDAYAAGVNAYIADRSPAQLALEFGIIGLQGVEIKIEPWTPADSLIWGEMLIFDQSDQLSTELKNIDLLAMVGTDMYRDLTPAYRDDRPVIVQTDELVFKSDQSAITKSSLGEAELEYLLAVREAMGYSQMAPQDLAVLGFGLSGGSNSFVIHGNKTDTGMPLLANDPHMGIQAPSLWYEVGMHCVEKSSDCIYNFRGFSLPGVPGILIGHNDRIAWGLTNAAFDSEDVFIERLNPENPNQYEVNGEWVDMEIRREEIVVRGQEEPVVMFVRSTRNGVVATDHMIDQPTFNYGADGPEIFALSYAWTALEPVQPVRAVMGVLRAQNWDAFVDSLQYFEAGKQNWVYADVEGNIGYVLPGKIPIRAGGDGSLPVPGWNDDYIWTGFIPYDELPKSFIPEKGYIATANNPQVLAAEYPYLINISQDRGQRAQRITDLIEGDRDEITLDDLIAIQTDTMSLSALEILPYLQDLPIEAADTAAARNRLLEWDAQMHMNSPEAAFFNIFWAHLLAETFHDQLPENLYPSGAHATSDTVYFLLQAENDVWWDDVRTASEVEDRDIILIRALEAAYAEGIETFGDNFDEWQWGDLHTITYRNAVLGQSGISVIESLFNRGPYATSGSESVIQKTCWSARDPYEVNCIPALRQVIDLNNLSNSRMVHNLGQSGHPMHPHYADFVDPWRLYDYHPSNWGRFDIEAREHEVLILRP